MDRPRRILIVDDEPNLRLMFGATLEPAGYEVEEAVDGRTALERLSEGRFDLVLLDLKMPGPNGLETLAALRAAGMDVPVVIVTAHGSVPDAVEAMKLGAIDFLQKPLTPESLRRVVAEVLRRQEAAASPVPAPPRPPADERGRRDLIDAAKRALNRRHFEEAEDLLRHAAAARPDSAEVRALLDAVRKVREEDTGPYHMIRNLT